MNNALHGIKIKIGKKWFLLPGAVEKSTIEYIVQHKKMVLEYIAKSEKLLNDQMNYFSTGAGLEMFGSYGNSTVSDQRPDMSEFKQITGIIGYPFDIHDPDLYAQDRGIEIVMKLNL